jgi:hypothetical protein
MVNKRFTIIFTNPATFIETLIGIKVDFLADLMHSLRFARQHVPIRFALFLELCRSADQFVLRAIEAPLSFGFLEKFTLALI